jgi:hypothetical protein
MPAVSEAKLNSGGRHMSARTQRGYPTDNLDHRTVSGLSVLNVALVISVVVAAIVFWWR